MARVLTHQNILTTFKDIAERHYQINEIFIGEKWDIGAEKQHNFPLLVVNLENSTIEQTINGFNILKLNYNIKVIDLINNDISNEEDVISDTLQIFQDIVKEVAQHPYYNDSNLSIDGNVNMEVAKGVSDENLTGVEGNIIFKLISNQSYCDIPISGITKNVFPNS